MPRVLIVKAFETGFPDWNQVEAIEASKLENIFDSSSCSLFGSSPSHSATRFWLSITSTTKQLPKSVNQSEFFDGWILLEPKREVEILNVFLSQHPQLLNKTINTKKSSLSKTSISAIRSQKLLNILKKPVDAIILFETSINPSSPSTEQSFPREDLHILSKNLDHFLSLFNVDSSSKTNVQSTQTTSIPTHQTKAKSDIEDRLSRFLGSGNTQNDSRRDPGLGIPTTTDQIPRIRPSQASPADDVIVDPNAHFAHLEQHKIDPQLVARIEEDIRLENEKQAKIEQQKKIKEEQMRLQEEKEIKEYWEKQQKEKDKKSDEPEVDWYEDSDGDYGDDDDDQYEEEQNEGDSE